jgi:secretion/DNA translocation related TadE-like protein
VFVLAVGLVMVAAGLAGAAVGVARTGRHRAQVAADLGALAGAMHAIEGTPAACAAAARYVAANGGAMSSCTVEGLEIVVGVQVKVTGLPGPAREAHAAARAGPVSAAPG